MLALTCPQGATLRIGDEIHLTLQGRLGNRVTVGAIAPAGADLYFDNVCLQPLLLPSGAQSYLFSLLRVRRFRIDEVEIGVWLPGDRVPAALDCDDFIHVGVIAPQEFRIGYEQGRRERMPSVAPSRPAPACVWH
jgi:hypothetical protein